MKSLPRTLNALFLLVCVVFVAALPGSSSRPLVFVLSAPPLPVSTPDRDAVVVVTARAPDGSPVSGAEVQAFAIVEGRAYSAGGAKASADGKATLRDLPHGEHWIVAQAKGRARASSHVVLASGERAIEVELGSEHTVTIEVKDEQNAPIDGAELEIASKDPLPIGGRTGSNGVANVGRLGPPPWVVTARAPGFEEVTQRGVRDAGLRVTLRRLGALVVRVVGSDGAPAAGARVLVSGPSLWPARITETKDDGIVRIGALTSGSYAMRATKGDLASAVELGVPLARGEEKNVTLELRPGVRVTAVVADEAGEPVASARVTLAEGGLSPFPLEATTDRKGRATLGPIASGPASLSVSAEGFVSRGVPVDEAVGGEVKITLMRAGLLEGRVVDARGYPIDGASIVVIGTDFGGAPIDEDPRRSRFREAHFDAMLRGPAPLLPMGELGVMPGPVPAIPHAAQSAPSLDAVGTPSAPPPEPWVTRADGTFRATPVSPGRVRVLVRHPQYTDALSDIVTLASGATAKVDVVMRAGGTLEGRIVDARGRPVSGARVAIAAMRGSMERGTKTASDGSFAFAAVPEDVVVSVSRDEELEPAARVTVTIPDGERRTITLTIPDPRPSLDARVTDDRGYPVDAAQLGVQSLDPGAPLRVTAFTNARGEAQIPAARGLPLRVEARAPGHAPKIVTVDAAAAGLLVTLDPAESATGEVIAAHGRGERIDGAEVVMYTDLGARHAKTDGQGTFTLTELSAGPARLRVRAAGYAPKDMRITIDALRGARPFVIPRIELERDGTVEGTIVDARGEYVQGARIAKDRVPVYLAMGKAPAGVAVSDARGHFRLAELAEGSCALEIYAPDLGRTRVEGVRVVAGGVTDVGKISLKKDADVSTDPGARGGVAVTLGETAGGEVVLVAVTEASEAERVGLAPGDVLVDVDGVEVHTISEARAKLSGPVGNDVVVTLRRAEKALKLRVPREEVRR